MVKGLKKGLEKLRTLLGQPVKLSDLEKEKFRKVIEQFKELLDENLDIMLDMQRDEAYRYLNLLIQAFQQADANFMAGASSPEESIVPPTRDKEPVGKKPAVEIGMPEFWTIFEELTPEEKEKARLLDCIKTAMKLIQDGEDPNQILCRGPDRVCSVEEMRRCIRIEDPSIDPGQDIIDEVNLARERGEL